ncbi:P-loop containing nucleoside triphosphate hydrolase protein [Trametes versicolor FP-101664 SS1]|uniref:P-loop containing nucleoside triphosphate hydrolase protein n=1 Tax=Trametes versicolor (strain FP-101664) TaxID=717944 RepID=UPI00046231C8|nr:P-loop containing nucleoside triphosphate hydrolase protein [Trametes versicolor FP-101664 SS1]EIW61392.1 P-loop containing nucleoside triphosphate hydrolase protein [Trametes versicolor FP-101664 SS1]
MSTSTSAASPAADLPDISEIRRRTTEKLGRQPCLWQCDVAQAILKGDKDIVCISGTGSGKTLTFWMPLLFRPRGIQLVITPLNILGTQNKKQLHDMGISAVVLSGETATRENFKAAGTLSHGVVVLNPEIAFRNKRSYEWLWMNKNFTSRLISVVWDEAHCIKSWGSFRPSLKESGHLRNLLSAKIPYVLMSATMTDSDCSDVLGIVQARADRVLYIRRSNDRPNVFLTVRKMQHSASSFEDLFWLIPDRWVPGQRIPPFVIFHDSIEESINAAEALRKRLPREYADRLVWFNSDNTPWFRERTTDEFREHKLAGLFCTDSFGMGVDVPNIEIVVQWKATCDVNQLWQRFGRAARGPGTEALAVLIVEPKHFDDEKEQAAARAQKRQETEARKAVQKESAKRKRAGTDAAQGANRERADPKRTRAGSRTQGVEAPHGLGHPPSAEGQTGQATVDITNGPPQERAPVLPASASLGNHEGRSVDLPPVAVGGPGPSVVVESREPSGGLTEYESLRVSYSQLRHAPEEVGGGKKQKKAKEVGAVLSPELDSVINAGLRPTQCYRKPITAFYENDRRKPDKDACCPRCFVPPPPSRPCCSLCSPEYHLLAILPSLTIAAPPKPAAASRASKVQSKYTMSAADVKLQAALNTFRRDKTAAIYGRSHLLNMGGSSIMTNNVLQRIVDCARARKLTSTAILYRETKWSRVDELGEEVLRVVAR